MRILVGIIQAIDTVVEMTAGMGLGTVPGMATVMVLEVEEE